MSTKSSLIVIAVVAFLALAGMGAAQFVGPQNTNNQPGRTEAIRQGDQMAQHADALADSPLQSTDGVRYSAASDTWPQIDAATAAHLRVIEQHGEALQEITP